MESVFQIINDTSAIALVIMIGITSLLGVVYFLDIGWNVVRAILDRDKGFSYYFSEDGPDN